MAEAVVIVPTYNEKDNIGLLIEQILSQPASVDVWVVDDASPDGTSQIVEAIGLRDPRVRLLQPSGQRGYGKAVLFGFKAAIDEGYQVIVTMDADLSHDPAFLPEIFKMLEGGADLVVGSRYVNGVSVINWPIWRLVLSVLANRYVRFVTGLSVSDCTSGYRAIRREVLETINLDSICSDGYSFISEVNYRAMRKKFRLVECPIIFVERRKGMSKMSKRVVFEAVFMPWRLRLASLFSSLSGKRLPFRKPDSVL